MGVLTFAGWCKLCYRELDEHSWLATPEGLKSDRPVCPARKGKK